MAPKVGYEKSSAVEISLPVVWLKLAGYVAKALLLLIFYGGASKKSSPPLLGGLMGGDSLRLVGQRARSRPMAPLRSPRTGLECAHFSATCGLLRLNLGRAGKDFCNAPPYRWWIRFLLIQRQASSRDIVVSLLPTSLVVIFTNLKRLMAAPQPRRSEQYIIANYLGLCIRRQSPAIIINLCW